MKREFLIERQGKSFVLFAGLLDAAHEKGLKSIRTQLLQAPGPGNGDTTIVSAEVEMEDGRVFAGIGDATPQNVGRNIVPHAIRMAETRAKARALRDALNIGGAALEELGGEDEDEPARPRQQPLRPQQPPPQQRRDVMPEPPAVDPPGQADEERHVPTPPNVDALAVSGANPLPPDETLAQLWTTAGDAVEYLRGLGVTDVGLPARTATAAELDAFINDARARARAIKARQPAGRR